jgi:hypothetical protein
VHELAADVRVVTPSTAMIVMMIVNIGNGIIMVLDFVMSCCAHDSTVWIFVANAPI